MHGRTGYGMMDNFICIRDNEEKVSRDLWVRFEVLLVVIFCVSYVKFF